MVIVHSSIKYGWMLATVLLTVYLNPCKQEENRMYDR